jgi:transcriptional regulator with XRE-family HTH domain
MNSELRVRPNRNAVGLGGHFMLVIARQVKAARSLLGWEQSQLAEASGVAISTIRRIEGLDGVISARRRTINRLTIALEEAGVEFIGEPGPGVRLRVTISEAPPISSRSLDQHDSAINERESELIFRLPPA